MRKYSTPKNKLHDHIRNKECQQSFAESKSVNKINLTLFFISEKNAISDTDTSAAKSITPHKFNLSTFAPVENIVLKITILIEFFLLSTPLSIYRAMSSSIFTYKPYKKSYLTVVDLYMRYAFYHVYAKPLQQIL